MKKQAKYRKRRTRRKELAAQHLTDQRMMENAMQLARSGQLEQARDLCCSALEQNAGNPDAWHVLGMTLHLAGQHEHAADAYRKSIDLFADNSAVHTNLGVALAAAGDLVAAAESYRRALELEPELPEAHNNLANALRDLGRYPEAEPFYREAIRLRPDYGLAICNLGSVLERSGALEEAERHYLRALELNPLHVPTLNNMGSVLSRQERNEEAVQYYRAALKQQPSVAAAYSNLAFVFAKLGHFQEGLDLLRTAMQLDIGMASNYLFMLSKDPAVPPQQLFDEHRSWGQSLEAMVEPYQHDARPTVDRKLRIGYVSPDLRAHVVANYIYPVLANYDREQFEVICYAEVAEPDSVTEQLRKLVDGWRSTCGLDARQIAKTIYEDRIDILVDLAGHTANNRLAVFAHRPAPVQVSWMGYPNTTGLSSIDYRITSEFQDAADEQRFYTEQLVFLDGGSACFVPPSDAPPVADLPALKNDHITFGSLHRLDKITDQTFDHWARVMKAVPNSRMLVFWPTLFGARADWMREQFSQRGIEANRLDLCHEFVDGHYFPVYHQIDIGLDPIPWTGSTTTKEAMWMGVVPVALYGKRRSSRGSAVVLHQVGLDKLIATTPERYVDLVVEIAGDIVRLAELRSGMRQRMRQRLSAPETYTRDVEELFRSLWGRQLNEADVPESCIAN